jgi:hypothetical protein
VPEDERYMQVKMKVQNSVCVCVCVRCSTSIVASYKSNIGHFRLSPELSLAISKTLPPCCFRQSSELSVAISKMLTPTSCSGDLFRLNRQCSSPLTSSPPCRWASGELPTSAGRNGARFSSGDLTNGRFCSHISSGELVSCFGGRRRGKGAVWFACPPSNTWVAGLCAGARGRDYVCSSDMGTPV